MHAIFFLAIPRMFRVLVGRNLRTFTGQQYHVYQSNKSRFFASSSPRSHGESSSSSIEESKFESLAVEELEYINESRDSQIDNLPDNDVTCELHDGVLTIEFPKGMTFVLNKHSASKQIWYSSPVSKPAYFDPPGWVSEKLGGMTLRQKLKKDISTLVGNDRLDL